MTEAEKNTMLELITQLPADTIGYIAVAFVKDEATHVRSDGDVEAGILIASALTCALTSENQGALH